MKSITSHQFANFINSLGYSTKQTNEESNNTEYEGL